MTKDLEATDKPARATPHTRLALRWGNVASLEAEIEPTSARLLAVTVLVSGILLSTTVLVATAIREGKRTPRR